MLTIAPRRHAGGATLWREVGDGLYHYLSASHPKKRTPRCASLIHNSVPSCARVKCPETGYFVSPFYPLACFDDSNSKDDHQSSIITISDACGFEEFHENKEPPSGFSASRRRYFLTTVEVLSRSLFSLQLYILRRRLSLARSIGPTSLPPRFGVSLLRFSESSFCRQLAITCAQD